MTEQTEQQGRPAGGGPDPERTQALEVVGPSVEGSAARTAPRDATPAGAPPGHQRGEDQRGEDQRGSSGDGERPHVAGVAPGRSDDASAQGATAAERAPARHPDGSTPVELSKGPAPREGAAGPDPARVSGDRAPDGDRARAATPRSPGPRPAPRAAGGSGRSGTAGRQRRARLRLRSVDPWSVFVLALLISLFLAVVLVVAVVALYAVLQAAGVPDSINALYAEVTRSPEGGEPEPLLSAGRALTAAGVLAVVNVVVFTALATLSAVLYNLCASFTGGVEVTLAEHDG